METKTKTKDNFQKRERVLQKWKRKCSERSNSKWERIEEIVSSEDEMHQKQKRIPSTGAQKTMVGRSIEQTRKNMQRLRVQRIGCPVRGKEKNVGRESLQMTIQSFIFMNQLLFFASKLQYSLQYMFCVNKIPLTISHLK